MLRGTWREAAAEFLGTFLILVFGTASVAQKILSNGTAGSPLAIHLSWGLAVTMGIYASAGVSGAHLNPAVTLAFAAFRDFPWRKVPAYFLAQTAGAFAGAAVTFVTYREAFDAFDGGVRQVAGDKATAGIFATYPQPFLSAVPGGFVDQVVGTALLLLVIFALGDRRNAGPASGGPVLVGALVVAHRDDLRLQRGLRDQPRARPRAAGLHRDRRLGERGLPRRGRLVVGADRRPLPRRAPGRLRLRPADHPTPPARASLTSCWASSCSWPRRRPSRRRAGRWCSR